MEFFEYAYLLVFGYGSIFRHRTVGAVNDIISGLRVPLFSFGDGGPLCHGACVRDACQTAGAAQHAIAYVGQAVRQIDGGDIVAVHKRIITDMRDALGDGNLGQLTSLEGLLCNAGHASVTGDDAVLASEDQGVGCGFDQTVVDAVVGCISHGHTDALQLHASGQSAVFNVNYTPGDVNACQTVAQI